MDRVPSLSLCHVETGYSTSTGLREGPDSVTTVSSYVCVLQVGVSRVQHGDLCFSTVNNPVGFDVCNRLVQLFRGSHWRVASRGWDPKVKVS